MNEFSKFIFFEMLVKVFGWCIHQLTSYSDKSRCTSPALQTKLQFYSVINNLNNIKTPLHALKAINYNHLNNFELRRLFKVTTKLRPINSRSIELSGLLYSKLENPNHKDLKDLIGQLRFGTVDESVKLFDKQSSTSNLIDLLKLAAKLPNKQLYKELFSRLQSINQEFHYRVVVIHLFNSSNKVGYLNRVFKHINHGVYDDGQLRLILFKVICLLLDGELSSYGNNIYDAMALLDEWNKSFFRVGSGVRSTTHPIFSLSNYHGLPHLNRPLTPAYLMIMQKAAHLGELTVCFNILRDLVDQNALIDRLASDDNERSLMRTRLSTFQPLPVPLNTYITLYQVCKTSTHQSIDQRRHLLLQLHSYFITQPSFAVIKGRNTVLLDNSAAAAPSPNQIHLILTTFLTVTEDRRRVLSVWQDLRTKFRKCSGWNKVERFYAVRKILFDCRDELEKEAEGSGSNSGENGNESESKHSDKDTRPPTQSPPHTPPSISIPTSHLHQI